MLLINCNVALRSGKHGRHNEHCCPALIVPMVAVRTAGALIRCVPTTQIAFLQFLDLHSFANQYFDPGMTSRDPSDVGMRQNFQHRTGIRFCSVDYAAAWRIPAATERRGTFAIEYAVAAVGDAVGPEWRTTPGGHGRSCRVSLQPGVRRARSWKLPAESFHAVQDAEWSRINGHPRGRPTRIPHWPSPSPSVRSVRSHPRLAVP